MTFLTILGATEILCSFSLVLEGKTVWPNGWEFIYELSDSGFESSCKHSDKGIPESSRLDFLETFPVNNFDLSDAEDNTYSCWIEELL